METNAQYHADLTHFGSTMLKDYRKSPRRFKALYIDRTMERDEPSVDMVLGSITHCLVAGTPILEEFHIAFGCEDRRGKKWEAAKAEAEEKAVTPITESAYRTGQAMAESVLSDSIARQYWEADGPTEHPIRWERQGLKLKCKPDKLVIDQTYDYLLNASLKTSAKADLPEFLYAVRDYDYDLSEAMYIDGILSVDEYRDGNPQALFVVVSKEPPHDVFVYHAEEKKSVMPQGRVKYEDTLNAIAESIRTGDWRSPGQKEIRSI